MFEPKPMFSLHYFIIVLIFFDEPDALFDLLLIFSH